LLKPGRYRLDACSGCAGEYEDPDVTAPALEHETDVDCEEPSPGGRRNGDVEKERPVR
jgi:hypothetical protein